MNINDQNEWGNQSGGSAQDNENEQSRSQGQGGQGNSQSNRDGHDGFDGDQQSSDGQQSNQHGRGNAGNEGMGNEYSSDPDADDLLSGTENGRDAESAGGSDYGDDDSGPANNRAVDQELGAGFRSHRDDDELDDDELDDDDTQ